MQKRAENLTKEWVEYTFLVVPTKANAIANTLTPSFSLIYIIKN